MIRSLNAALVAVLLVAAPVAWGDTFHVEGGSGSDSNDGSAATPFKTIQHAIDAAPSAGRSTVYVNAGVYHESVSMNKAGLSLIGVGNTVIENQATGITALAPDLLIENLQVRNCSYGLYPFTDNMTIRRCRFAGNVYGMVGNGRGFNVHIENTDVCCSNNVGIYLWLATAILYRVNLVENGWGIDDWAEQHFAMNDCIVAFNTGGGIQLHNNYASPVLESNDFFQNNGFDIRGGSGQVSALGPRDVTVDPQFLDEAHHIFALKSTSTLLNAGIDVDGLPVTIGAHEAGVLCGAMAAATVNFSSWTDGTGRLVTDSAADVVLSADGFLRLNGVNRGVALSPVIDLGDDAATSTNAFYTALEELEHPSGQRRVVDADDATFAREFRLRAQPSTFGALDPSPIWMATTSNGNHYNLRGRYLQIEITLTNQGK